MYYIGFEKSCHKKENIFIRLLIKLKMKGRMQQQKGINYFIILTI